MRKAPQFDEGGYGSSRNPPVKFVSGRPDSNRRRPAWEIFRGGSAGIPRYTYREVSELGLYGARPERVIYRRFVRKLSESVPAPRAAFLQRHSADRLYEPQLE